MRQQEIDIKLDVELEWKYEVSIEQLESDIVKLKELGCTHVQIDAFISYGNAFISYGDASMSITAVKKRIETEEEAVERTKKEESDRKEKAIALIKRTMEYNNFKVKDLKELLK